MVPEQLPQILIFPPILFFHRLVSAALIDLMFKARFLRVPGSELQWSLKKQTDETPSSREASDLYKRASRVHLR